MKFEKKVLIITIAMIMVLNLLLPIVLATNASLSFKASNESPYVGESVTITATVVAGGFNLTLSGNGETKQIVGQTDKTDNVSKSESITFTPTEAKTYTFTLTGDYTDYNTDKETAVNKTITVTAKAKEETKPTTTEEKPATTEEPKTNETTVTFKDVNETVYATTDVNVRSGPSTSNSSLGGLSKNASVLRTGVGSKGWSRIKYNGGTAYVKSDYLTTTKPKEEVTFTDVNETVYATKDVNVRKGPSTSDNAIGKLEKGKSVTRTGVGSNGWSRVTYNNETAYISSDYLTTTAPEDTQKTNNANLKTLEIEGQTLVPEFLPDVTSYTMKVGKDVEKLKINAKAEDEKATVSIKGNETLKEGENTVTISVSAEDGTVKIYEIKVEKTAEETATLGLKSLSIKGLDNNIKFKQNVYNYEVQIEDAMTKLDIEAVATAEDAVVEILGNEDLQKGENIITIIVSSKDGEEKVTYQIKAIKGKIIQEEEKVESASEPNLKLYIYIGAFAVLLIALIIVVVYAIKHRKNDEYDDDYEEELEEIPDALRRKPEKLYNQELEKDFLEEKPIEEEKIDEEQIPNTTIDYDYEEPKENRRKHGKGRHF